jgi:hypothetical protein
MCILPLHHPLQSHSTSQLSTNNKTKSLLKHAPPRYQLKSIYPSLAAAKVKTAFFFKTETPLITPTLASSSL